MTELKISIISATLYRCDTLSDTINSVLSQSYSNIKYVIIDGVSGDNTIDRIKSYGNKVSVVISDPDSEMFDAINKGIRLTSGEIVGIINSDDFFFIRMKLAT